LDSTNLYLKFAVFFAAVASVTIATGPGLFGATDMMDWFASWQRFLFMGTCHQLPDRSYLISGIPMAVCSRCYGLYWGLLAGLPLVLMIPSRFHLRKPALLFLAAVVILITADVVITMAGLWQNTLTSRFITGLLLGSSMYIAIFFNR
jgi:uncharacterized membrane protein